MVVKEFSRVCKDLVILTILKRLKTREEIEALFKDYFEVLDYREEERDHCFLLRVKGIVKSKKLRLRF